MGGSGGPQGKQGRVYSKCSVGFISAQGAMVTVLTNVAADHLSH